MIKIKNLLDLLKLKIPDEYCNIVIDRGDGIIELKNLEGRGWGFMGDSHRCHCLLDIKTYKLVKSFIDCDSDCNGKDRGVWHKLRQEGLI